jgi:Flp pilus assembly protein protease CpaA
VRVLNVLVVVMGVLIVGGTVALGVLLVQRVGSPAGSGRWEVALEQPEGTRIAGIATAEGGIGIWVVRPDGDRVLLVDPKQGRVVGDIRPGR